MLTGISRHTFTAFVLFIVLVWLSVDLGRVLPKVLPKMPELFKRLMDPTTMDANTREMTHL